MTILNLKLLKPNTVKKQITLLLSILLCFSGFAQQPDKALTEKLQKLISDSGLEAGVYVRHIAKNRIAAINADTLYPTASTIKLPILCGLFDKIEKGELKYNTVLTYRDSLAYSDFDITAMLKDSSKISLGKIALLMESVSDNTASLWCQAMAGGGVAINQWLDDNGFKDIRVNSRTPGREENRKVYGWGQTTPREMAELLALIRAGKAISPAASERIYRILCKTYWDDRSLSQVPPYVQAASKQGFVSTATSEVVMVNAPHGDYVFCVATKNQKSKSAYKNEGAELIRQVSKLLWSYFEPDSKWQPAPDMEKYSE